MSEPKPTIPAIADDVTSPTDSKETGSIATKTTVFTYADTDLPPGRLTATKGHTEVRLRGSSRSKSPMPNSCRHSVDGNSSISSLDDILLNEPDILYDRQGLEDLKNHSSSMSQGSISNLPPVHERLSEETLDDVHAFSDLRSSNASLVSINTDNAMLEPVVEMLDDIEEEEDAPVILMTNMENLRLESQQETPTASSSVNNETVPTV